ncbi:MAG: DegT/DnrJ/EryC1/StrS family aminotransferase [Bacteroidales bacterium]|nr:DegT/DnrJ/EryC1/StrS family aminotransferase [Bacteroidales bacterium]
MIQMVDLKGQYLKVKAEIDDAINKVINETDFINGKAVKDFSVNLASYLNVKHVIPCANGTDALQIALMSLDLNIGDEIIVPAFTYVATAEVIGLLNLIPVLVDVDFNTFNIDVNSLKNAITKKTKAIVPVHLFGQCANMEKIMNIANEHNLYVIEDNAQAIGADYKCSDNTQKKSGTIGHIGCTSFFPSKNLGCYGDGGAIFTNDDTLALKIKMIANHGQNKKYYHKYIGVNSRLDTIQAAILDVKLKYLDNYNNARHLSAKFYSENLKDIEQIQTPVLSDFSTHVFHQYTLIIKNNKRDELKEFLNNNNISANIYYPLPLNEQEAFKSISKTSNSLKNTNELCKSVLSLPIHTELNKNTQNTIILKIKEFFKNNQN